MKTKLCISSHVWVAAALLLCGSAHSRNEWLTSRVQGDHSVPMSYEALQTLTPPMGDEPQNLAPQYGVMAPLPSGPTLLDLTMSIIDDPAGDNNGNTQGAAGSQEQDKWERIVQHFADAIFEMTEGAHKIRNVKIFRKGQFSSQADVVWTEKGHPHVSKGVGEPGGSVQMFKIFVGGRGAGRDKDMLADEIGSGYTMAHEYGHYFYGVYDEYVPQGNTTDVAVAPSVMSSQWRAVSGDYDWLNFSIAFNGGGPFQNTQKTSQHRIHGASCWETLVRLPSNDLRVTGLGRRRYFPELSAVAPTGTATPTIQLPNAAARNQLNIMWTDKVIFELVIDNSGSMAGSPISNAKAAAKMLVDRATVGETKIGVVKFSSTASVVAPVTAIQSEADKTSLKNLIDSITATGNTAIGDGALLGLSQSTSAGTQNDTPVVFLLSDGASNTGTPPLNVIPTFQSAKVPLFTFAFGSGADAATLRQMAEQTGGRFYSSPTSLSEITLAFQDAFSSVMSDPVISQWSATVPAKKTTSTSFPVDVGIKHLQVTVIAESGLVDVKLKSPRRVAITPTSTVVSGSETAYIFDLTSPALGSWSISAKNSNTFTPKTLRYTVSGPASANAISLAAYSLEGTDIRFPAPVLVRATLKGSRPIAGATVTAVATAPSRTLVPFTLADNGIAPDNIAGDGTYSAYFYYTENGVYDFNIKMDNRRRTARYTSKGNINSPNIDGKAPPAERDSSVRHSFARTARFAVTASGGRFTVARTQLPTGTYTALFGTGSGHDSNGIVQLRLAAKGAYSGRVRYEGVSYSISGSLNNHGALARNLSRPGKSPLQLALRVDALNGSNLLTGTLIDGGLTLDVSARRATWHIRSNPAPQAGKYTCLFLSGSSSRSDGAPLGDGYGFFKVGADGSCAYSGRLADGTVFTGSTYLLFSGDADLYMGLYSSKGSLYGSLDFANLTGISDFSGVIRWTKPSRVTDKRYPAGFTTSGHVVASRYNPPARGQTALQLPSGTVAIRDGGLAASGLTVDVTQNTSGRYFAVPPTSGLQLSVIPSNGLFRGSFKHPDSNATTSFVGAALQKQNSAGATFFSGNLSGSVELGTLLSDRDLVPYSASATGLPLAIPDNNTTGVTSSISFSGSGTVIRASISLAISHTYRGDLEVSLIYPGGNIEVLHNRVGGSEDNLFFTDLPLASAAGVAKAGTWSLKVRDLAGADIGSIQSWSLKLMVRP